MALSGEGANFRTLPSSSPRALAALHFVCLYACLVSDETERMHDRVSVGLC